MGRKREAVEGGKRKSQCESSRHISVMNFIWNACHSHILTSRKCHEINLFCTWKSVYFCTFQLRANLVRMDLIEKLQVQLWYYYTLFSVCKLDFFCAIRKKYKQFAAWLATQCRRSFGLSCETLFNNEKNILRSSFEEFFLLFRVL